MYFRQQESDFWDEEKSRSKIVEINPNIIEITVNVNKLNEVSKRQNRIQIHF